jgi:hypothetical protein
LAGDPPAKPPAEGFDAHPQFSAQTFQRREARPPAGEIKSERDHETAGDEFDDPAHLRRRSQAQCLGAQGAEQRAGDGIARDAPEVVGGKIRKQPDGRAADVIVHPNVSAPTIPPHMPRQCVEPNRPTRNAETRYSVGMG